MNVTLPSTGKTKAIFDVAATSSGKTISQVVVENDAIMTTFYVSSLAGGATLDITIEEIGNDTDNTKVVHRFPQVSVSLENPQSTVLQVGGVFRFTAEYTGAVDFEMRGRAVSSSALAAFSTQKVQLVTTEADDAHRDTLLSTLHNINTTLNKILNHQRVLTSINERKGDVF